MPPITVVFVITGLAVWMNGLAFLGIGSKPQGDGPNPLITVGWVTLIAGIVDLVNAVWIIQKLFGGDSSDTGIRLAGLVTFYGTFFVALGICLVRGLDLRPIGNLSVAVAIVPLFWWNFFDGSWMFQSILVVWAVAFLGVTALTYGKLKAEVGGALLVATAVYTFLVPAIILATGNAIP